MAYKIPIMSGLTIPNGENLTDEQIEALGKLYLLHSKHVEVDGKKILNEQISENESIDLQSLLGQLVKTVGAVQWNKSGLNGVTPDERVYPNDALSEGVQERLDQLDSSIGALSERFNSWEGRAMVSIQANYLDNTDFTRLINQRGQNEYTCEGRELYTIDRWFLSDNGASLSILQNGIDISNGMLYERFELPNYQSVWTFVAEPIEGDNVTLVVNFNSATSFASEDGKINVSVNDNIGTVGLGAGQWKTIAMYPGERIFDEENPYVYIPKSYQDEFVTCLRYFYRFEGQAPASLADGRKVLNTYCLLPMSMRIAPTRSIFILSDLNIQSARMAFAGADRTVNSVIKPESVDSLIQPDNVNIVDYMQIGIENQEGCNSSAGGLQLLRLTPNTITKVDGKTLWWLKQAGDATKVADYYLCGETQWATDKTIATSGILGYCRLGVDFSADL